MTDGYISDRDLKCSDCYIRNSCDLNPSTCNKQLHIFDAEGLKIHDTKVRAEMLEEVIKAIDESNYCMLEDCPFYKHCGYHLCPLDSNGLTIIQNWLEKWMEQLKEQKNDIHK